VRPFIVVSLVLAAAIAAPAAYAARQPYADFKVSFKGTETAQVTGSEDCEDDAGTIAPASASETANFSSAKSRTLEFERAGRELNIFALGDVQAATMVAKASLTRQSQFGPNGSPSTACSGGQPNPACGNANLTHVVMLLQGGLNKISFLVNSWKPQLPVCLVPMAYGFPAMLAPSDDGSGSHIKYSAPAPRSLLNPHKHVIVIHGKATATNSGREGDIHVTSAVSTLKFTMRLVRVPLRLH
jgi:hypothetical protein